MRFTRFLVMKVTSRGAGMALVCLVWVSIACFGQEVRIIDPQGGAYLSGICEIRIESRVPDVVRTNLIVDSEIVATVDGAAETVDWDFGETIERHEIQVEMIDQGGTVFRSPKVVTRALRVDYRETSRLILVSAIVKTRSNKAILDLERDDFTVLEKGVPLEIRSFFREEVPLDLVLLLDTSSSMKRDIGALRRAADQFVIQLEAPDRVSIFEFNSQPQKLIGFSTDRKKLRRVISQIDSYGQTALFDALDLGIQALEGRQRGRKAIVLFTDGRDSRYEEPEQKRRLHRRTIRKAQNGEITLFTIGLGKRIHEAALADLALETGGRYYYARRGRHLGSAFGDIISDLRSLYLLGVVPRDETKGFHDLELRVDKSGAQVYARKGYTLE